ncbi:hypothetical protein ACROYT_G003309 [Oculina patagonica]
MSPLNPVMDWVNRETAHKHPDLAEWRKCQAKAGWYGTLSVIIGSGVAFAGLSLFRQVPKKYIPLLSLSAGAGCGWLVANRIVMSYRRTQMDPAVADVNQSLEKEDNGIPPLQESKFGDKNFIKE